MEEKYYSEVDERKEKVFITAAFPYPNSPQHIGHARTYTITDVYARYNRLRGKNVLFPMGFHVTGTPIIAMAKRIEEKDEELLDIFERIYGISRETAEKLTDPKNLVMYFSKEIEEGMKLLGLSIDWRRKFYSFDKHFNKFIEWQFKKLKDKGYIVKGEHPVPWSVKLNSAVGAHDTKGDVDPEIEEITAIKFKFEDGYLLTATYRPETIYGVTNIWINKEEKYVKVRTNDEIYFVSKKAFEKLKYQIEGEVLEEKEGSYFIGKKAKNLATERDVPIYNASFVKGEEGTGIVMSVPAHAPYDYAALRDIGKVELIKIIDLKGYDIPAKEIVEKMSIKDQNDEKLEEATKIIYKEEAYNGKMLVEKYKGMSVKEAKEKVKEDLVKEGKALKIWVIANSPVYSRAGDEVIVKIVKDQWFIDYGNKEWKEKTKNHINNMRIIPESIRKQFIDTVEWLNRKACTRSSGLGTRFPFDKDKMIEALSDSTIYMAFYTISHKIKQFREEELDEEFFDYLFLGKGKAKNSLHEELRKEFLYWYPLDSRHSGADLIRNHLTFFIYNHVAVFPPELWPRQIVVNGFVLMEGKKMSKSFGNILPLKKAIKEYSADVIRLSVVGGSDLLQDSDFSKSVAEGVKSRLKFFKSLASYGDREGNSVIDKWLSSRINSKLKKVEGKFEKFKLREIVLDMFYEMYSDLQWYVKRAKEPSLKEFFEKWSLVMHPFIPFTTEEIWKELKGKDIIKESYPEYEEDKISYDREKSEEIIRNLIEDVKTIEKLTGKKAEKVYVYVSDEWKYKLFNLCSELKDMNKIREEIKKSFEKEKIGEAMKLLGKISKEIHKMNKPVRKEILIEHIKDAKELIEEEVKAKVEILEERQGKHKKAGSSLPEKPAIVIE